MGMTDELTGKKHEKVRTKNKGTDEVYILALLRFVNDEMVYTEEEVKRLKQTVLSGNKNFTLTTGKRKKHKRIDRFEYCYNMEYIHELIKDESNLKCASIVEDCLENIEVYYYHHRIILKFIFNRGKKSSCEDRMLREFTKKLADILMQSDFVHRINSITEKNPGDTSGYNLIPYEKRVVLYYSYTVMFINNIKGFGNNIVDFLGSLTFRIVESGKIRFGRVHYIRISIPGMNVYFKKKISNFLKTDIINSVYQNALYQKKESDREESEKDTSGRGQLKDFSAGNLMKYNILQEKHLHVMWSYAQDNLGGKISDIQNKSIEKKSYLMSVIAIIISIIAILLTTNI
jgi:hypothetical protein